MSILDTAPTPQEGRIIEIHCIDSPSILARRLINTSQVSTSNNQSHWRP